MARPADASIVFDTRLDPGGFENGINNIDDSFERMRNTLVDVASASSEAFSGKVQKNIETLTSRLARQLEQLDKARFSVEKLRNEYDKLVSGETTPKSVIAMQKELEKVNAEMQKELANNERILQSYIEMGQAIDDLANKRSQFVVVDGQAISNINVAKQMYDALGDELEQSAQKLTDMDMRSKDLANNIQQVKLDPSTSEEAQNMAVALDQAAQRANRLANEAQLTERNIKNALDEEVPNRWDDAVKRGNKTAKKMAASVRNVGKEAKGTLNPIEKMVKSLLRMTRFTFFYSIIRAAFRGMKEYLDGLITTQSSYINSLNAVKVNLMTAFQPIFTAIMPALNALMSALATVTAYMAQFISMLFGQSYEASRAAAQATNQQAEALKNVGKEAKKASKSVQGFDQLNRQQSEDSSSGGAGAGGTSALFEQVPMPTLDPKWAKMFTDIINGIKQAAEPTVKALQRLWDIGLKPLMGFAWQTLKDFWTHFLVPVGTWVLGEGFPRFVDAITNQLALVDWERLNGAFERMWQALAPFAVQIGEGLLWFWEVVLTPFIGWALNNLVPAAIDLITAAIELLGNIVDAAMPALIWFWDTFLVPIRDFLWDATIEFLELFTDALEGLSDWAKKNPKVIETIAKIVLSFLAGLWVYNTTKKLVGFLATLGRQFVIFAGQMGTMVIAHLPAAAILALAAAFVIIGGMWDKLSPAQRAVVLLTGLAAAAIAAAIAIAVFHTSWTVGIAAAAIIGSIAAIGAAFATLKKDTGQSWSVKTPTIDPFGSAGSGDADSFMSKMSGDSGSFLPALAKGGLIPPRKPRPVIVGDNQYEEEIVSPRSAIREEVKNAITELGGVSGMDAQVLNVLMRILRAIEAGHTIEMDNRELGRTIIRTIRSVQNQTGQTQIQTVPGR
jgi:hypothetical protein